MKNTIYTMAAITAALLVVLSQRFIIPALILAFKAIEESYAPKEEQLEQELTPKQELADLQVILDDEDVERAAELMALPTEEAEPTTAKQTAVNEVVAPKPRRRRTRKTPVTA